MPQLLEGILYIASKRTFALYPICGFEVNAWWVMLAYPILTVISGESLIPPLVGVLCGQGYYALKYAFPQRYGRDLLPTPTILYFGSNYSKVPSFGPKCGPERSNNED